VRMGNTDEFHYGEGRCLSRFRNPPITRGRTFAENVNRRIIVTNFAIGIGFVQVDGQSATIFLLRRALSVQSLHSTGVRTNASCIQSCFAEEWENDTSPLLRARIGGWHVLLGIKKRIRSIRAWASAGVWPRISRSAVRCTADEFATMGSPG